MIGIEPQDLRKMLSSLGEPALIGEKNSQTKVGSDIAGLEPERFGIVIDSLGDAPLHRPGQTPRLLWASAKVGWRRSAASILLDGFLRLPLPAQGIPQVIVGAWIGAAGAGAPRYGG